MSALSSSDIIAAWTARMQSAVDEHPAVAFDGRVSLPAWLFDSARDQADRVFLVLDSTPVEARDMAVGEQLVDGGRVAFLEAWGWTMSAFGTAGASWAVEAAQAAATAYRDRLNELAPTIHSGGTA